jgi:hypothetical protein
MVQQSADLFEEARRHSAFAATIRCSVAKNKRVSVRRAEGPAAQSDSVMQGRTRKGTASRWIV